MGISVSGEIERLEPPLIDQSIEALATKYATAEEPIPVELDDMHELERITTWHPGTRQYDSITVLMKKAPKEKKGKDIVLGPHWQLKQAHTIFGTGCKTMRTSVVVQLEHSVTKETVNIGGVHLCGGRIDEEFHEAQEV